MKRANQVDLTVVPELSTTIDSSLYYQVPNWAAKKAIAAKLTGADWCVWAYLQMLDPFGDRFVLTPTPEEIAKEIDFSEKQVKRSLTKLEEMGFWEFKVLTWKGRNLATPKKKDKSVQEKTKLSERGQDCPQMDRIVQERTDLSADGQDCPNQSLEPASGKDSKTLQTYSDLIQTNSDVYQTNCVEIKNSENTHTGFGKISEPEPEATANLSQHQIINIEPVPTIQGFGEDQSSGGRLAKKTTKYDPALGMRPPAPKVTNLIPDGDWLTESGQLDPAFIRHVAKQWMDSPSASFHKMPVEEVEGLVFAHFAKRENHPNLVVKWESYGKVALRHAQGVKLRLDAEISIPESEQQQILNQGRAIASALNQPEEEKAVPSLPTQEDRKPFGFVLPPTAEPTPQLPQASKPVEVPLDDFGHAENPQAYQAYQVADITPEEQQANLGKLGALIRTNLKFGLKDKSTHSKKRAIATAAFPSNLSEANQWLSDPCLRSQAILWAKRECYLVHYTPEGTAFEIENPEF